MLSRSTETKYLQFQQKVCLRLISLWKSGEYYDFIEDFWNGDFDDTVSRVLENLEYQIHGLYLAGWSWKDTVSDILLSSDTLDEDLAIWKRAKLHAKYGDTKLLEDYNIHHKNNS